MSTFRLQTIPAAAFAIEGTWHKNISNSCKNFFPFKFFLDSALYHCRTQIRSTIFTLKGTHVSMVIKGLMISNISICRWSRCCNPKRFLAFANGNGSKNCKDYYDFWLVSCIQMILKFAFGMCCSYVL